MKDKIYIQRLRTPPLYRGIGSKKKVALSRIKQAFEEEELECRPLTNCLSCDSNNLYSIGKYDRYGLSVEQNICSSCSLIQQAEIFTEESVGIYYNKYYRQFIEADRGEKGFDYRYRRQQSKGRKIIKNLKGNVDKDTRIVEIGCGAGGIVQAFIEAGYEIEGYDIDPTYLEYGKEKGLPLYNENVFETNKKFDVVIIRHVLEHILDPQKFLSQCNSILKEGGLIYIEVPGLLDIKNGKYGYNLRDYFVLEHVTIFNLSSLIILLKKVGFSFISGDESIYALFRKGKSDTSQGVNNVLHDEVVSILNESEIKFRNSFLINILRRQIVKLKKKIKW